MTNNKISLAAHYMWQYGFLYKFGTGANSISTEACLKQQQYVETKFNLSHAEFSEAFKYAEELENEARESEKQFNKQHPELNP